MKTIHNLACCTFSFVLIACGKAPPVCASVEIVEFRVEGAERMNPNMTGESLPTVVHVLQLADAVPLENAAYEDIWSDASAALGESLISASEVTLFPNESRVEPLTIEDTTRFVAIAGVFREPAGWQSIFELPRDLPGCVPPDEPRQARLIASVQGSTVNLRADMISGDSDDSRPELPNADLVSGEQVGDSTSGGEVSLPSEAPEEVPAESPQGPDNFQLLE